MDAQAGELRSGYEGAPLPHNIENMRTPFRRGPVDPEVAAAQAQARKRRKIVFAITAVILLVLGYFILAAFLPRWWGRQVGIWCGDSFTKGLLYGLAFGLVCTFVPLIIASTVFFRRLNHQIRVAILALAVLVAAPNLLTLSIATGTGGGAHAGDRYMSINAPFFRGATLIGAIVAALLFLLTLWQYNAGRRVRAAKRNARLHARQGSVPAAEAATVDASTESSRESTPNTRER